MRDISARRAELDWALRATLLDRALRNTFHFASLVLHEKHAGELLGDAARLEGIRILEREREGERECAAAARCLVSSDQIDADIPALHRRKFESRYILASRRRGLDFGVISRGRHGRDDYPYLTVCYLG